MYIEPNTTIKLYSGIPLDNTYNHTLWFDSIGAQNGYFHGGIAKYTMANNSYQRVERGKMRIERKADDLYDCNYLAFQNSNYGNKWFYAFITGVEFINNVTSEVTFEIDAMQTYLFDVELKNCFVAREHSITDEVGDNILPESVACGEYIMSDYEPLSLDNRWAVIVMTVIDNSENHATLVDGIYSGCNLKAFRRDDLSSLKTYLDGFIQTPDSVVSIYMCPMFAIPDQDVGGNDEILNGHIITGGAFLHEAISSPYLDRVLNSVYQTTQDFGGYTPKNKKLYTYPYNFLKVDNACGDSLNLRYEFFDNLTPVLRVSATVGQPVQSVLRPCSYKGLPSYTELGGYTSSKSECLILKNFPLCSWSNDSYQRWISQKTTGNAIGFASKAVTGAISGAAIGGVYGAIAGAGIAMSMSVLDLIKQTYEASIQADECRGSINDANINVSDGNQRYFTARYHVTADYAQMIDDFFTMYGYATNKVKTPNRSSRPHWNYVQTKGCVVKGSAPSDEIRKICSIYDKGITFWKSASEVGDYTLNNAPT